MAGMRYRITSTLRVISCWIIAVERCNVRQPESITLRGNREPEYFRTQYLQLTRNPIVQMIQLEDPNPPNPSIEQNGKIVSVHVC